MSLTTKIPWCDSTVNFWSGCTKVSPGCDHCYAARFARRFPQTYGQWGPGQERPRHSGAIALAAACNRRPTVCANCGAPVSRDAHGAIWCGHCRSYVAWRRRRVFANDMSDWLDPAAETLSLLRLLDTLRRRDQVQWILCTKRPELFWDRLGSVIRMVESQDEGAVRTLFEPVRLWTKQWLDGTPPAHLHLLCSVENQEMADQRLPVFLRIPARLHGLSLEPLLGPVDLTRVFWPDHQGGEKWENVLTDGIAPRARQFYPSLEHCHPPFIQWLIVGGESGPQARPCQVEWIRRLQVQASACKTPLFIKQLGSHCVCRNDNGFDGESPTEFPMGTPTRDMAPRGYQGAPVRVLLKSAGANPAEWPEDLRLRQFPT